MRTVPAWVAVTALAVLSSACISGSTFTLYEENDGLGFGANGDEHYTQGARASWVFPREVASHDVRRNDDPVPRSTTGALGVVVGQEMYTPKNIDVKRLIENDRPYAGWLYAGFLSANVQRAVGGPEGDRLNSWEVDVGVVGPSSHAEDVQRELHSISGSNEPQGWDNQLRDEVGVVVTYEHRRRLLAGELESGHDWDVIGGVGASLGNVRTQGTAGAIVRFGDNLPRDFGVNTIHRTATDVGAIKPDRGWRWYLYGGVEGRAVARNIFLDGNTWKSSHDVDRNPLVGEATAGIALQYGNFRATLGQVLRSREFDGQDGSQSFGSLSLQYQLDF